MSQPSPAPAWLIDAIARDATIVTSSRRLAREYIALFDAAQVAAGRTAWPGARVLPFDTWLRQLAEHAEGEGKLLVSGAAAGVLWERCLDETDRRDVLNTGTLLRHARRAWERLHDWRLSPEAAAASAKRRDEHWFARAAKLYAARLAERSWLDVAQLPQYLAERIDGGQLSLPAEIVVAGFDRLTPAQEDLVERLATAGVRVGSAPEASRAGRLAVASFADDAAQWRSAGRWARQMLDRQPDAQVAIIAPDLDTDPGRIARLVREGFAPGWQLGGDAHRHAVDVSLGRRLADYPAIAVAFLCLRLCSEGLRGRDVGILLQTPLLATTARGDGARLDRLLREFPDRSWQLPDLLQALRVDPVTAGWPQLATLHAERDARRSPAAWAESIAAALEAAGWPGTTRRDSDTFQLINRWRSLLNELAALGRVLPSLTLVDAVRRLQQLAAETVFQPEGGGGLRLLGILEAAGLEFDAAWLGNLDASRWPPPARPLALLSRELQREQRMPDYSPADTLAYAERSLRRLQQSATELTVSWARFEDDRELLPSPLLADEGSQAAADDLDPGWHASTMLAGAPLVAIDNDAGPAVAVGEDIGGGAYTVQAMQEEPFSAFVKGRLHVSELEPYAAGLGHRLRGIAVHAALERLLADRPSQKALQAWSASDIGKRVEQAAWQALAPLQEPADDVLSRLLAIEKARLQKLLADFIERECRREAFTIDALERDVELRAGPLRLRLRLDRIDRLADTSLLLIDYKSGRRQPFLSRDRKPRQLQLYVYSRALEDESVGGVRYVYLDGKEVIYEGAGGNLEESKVAADDWSAHLSDACDNVDALLARLASGEIGVNLLQGVSAARRYALLSRFAELADGH